MTEKEFEQNEHCLVCGIKIKKGNKFCSSTCVNNYRWSKINKEERTKMMKKAAIKWKETYNKKSQEQKELENEKRSKSCKNFWKENPELKLKVIQKAIKTRQNWSEEKKKKHSKNLTAMNNEVWKNRTQEEKTIIANKISKTRKLFSKEKREDIKIKTLQARKQNKILHPEKYLKSEEQRKKREYETKKKNHTFNVSKPEMICFELLKQKYSNVIHGFRSELYPFNCDFYIPSLDLYIECHFSHYHNCEPFDLNNKEHIKELEILKSKSEEKHKIKNKKNQYDNIIYTWTNLDVRKLKTFKENKLNYKIFYTEKEFKEWYENI